MITRKRSAAKMVSWQTIGFFITLFITNYFTSEFSASIKITITGMVASSIVFYLHERTWNKIAWGKKINNMRG